MSFVAVAMGGASLIGGLTSGILGSNAAQTAAGDQETASNNALNFEKQVYNTQTQNEQPYLNAGTSNLATLQSDMPSLTQGFNPTAAGLPSQFSFDGSDLANTPGYQFAVQQGDQTLNNSSAASGSDVSGGALKALDAYNVGEADQNYNTVYGQQQGTYSSNYANAFNTYETNQNNTYSRLASMVGLGQSANGQLASAAQNFGNNASNIATGEGNAAAAGTVGSTNALTSGISGAMNGMSNGYLLSQILNNNMQSNGQGSTLGTSFNNMASTAGTQLTNPSSLVNSPLYNPSTLTASSYQ